MHDLSADVLMQKVAFILILDKDAKLSVASKTILIFEQCLINYFCCSQRRKANSKSFECEFFYASCKNENKEL